MSEVLAPIVSQLGVGGIGGFFLGYLIKKVLKFALMIGCFALVFFYFALGQVIEINYDQLLARAGEIMSTASQYLSPLLANIPFSGSLVMGVLAGFLLS